MGKFKEAAESVMKKHSELFKRLAEYEANEKPQVMYYSELHDKVGFVDPTWVDPDGVFEVFIEYDDGNAKYKDLETFIKYWSLVGKV